MKANELRIGNYIKYTKNTCLSTKGIRELTVQGFNNIATNKLNDNYVEPVLITNEEWQSIGCIDDILCDVSGFVIFKNGYAYQFIYSDYKHWHKLQNLYFALTNKELILNTNKNESSTETQTIS